MRFQIESPTDPYKVQKSLYLNIINAATLIELKYGGVLLPAPPGLYRMGELEPIFRSGVPYFTMHRNPANGEFQYREITDMSQVNSAVYDHDGRALVSAEFMKQKLFMLSPAPTIPSRSIKLIYNLFDFEIHNMLSWTANNRTPSAVLENFRMEYRHLVEPQEILLDVRHLWSQILDFIGEDVWCYYSLVIKDSSLYINKCQDYRVIQWEAGLLPSCD